MHRGRGQRARILLILLLGVLSLAGVAQGEYACSMVEIAESTPERWTETYATEWRTVAIDAPIQLPAVTAFPVVKVRLMPAVAQDKLAAYKGTVRNMDGSLTADRKKDDHAAPNSRPMNVYTYLNGEAPDRLPENVALTYGEALAICQEEIHRLWGLSASDFALRQVVVEDRMHHYRRRGDAMVWGGPANEAGRYKLTFSQLIHGIDVEGGRECYDRLGLSSEAAFHSLSCYMAFSNAEDMKIRAALYDEVETVYEDVPLLPFAKAKEAMEAEIYAGHLRAIDVVKLCYIPYSDAQEQDVLWLLPAWYVKGAYTRDAKAESPLGGMERREVIFQAQVGTLLDYTDASSDRRLVPRVFSWEETRRQKVW